MKVEDKEAREIIIKGSYSTSYRLQELVLNIYNCKTFNGVDILHLVRNADDEHIELFYDILKTVETNLNFINNLAEEIIEIHKLDQLDH